MNTWNIIISCLCGAAFLATPAYSDEHATHASVAFTYGVKTGSQFNSNYQPDAGGSAYFDREPEFDTTGFNIEIPVSNSDTTGISFRLSGAYGEAREKFTNYIGNAETATASLDGRIQTSSRFSNAYLNHRLKADDYSFRLALLKSLPLEHFLSASDFKIGGFVGYSDQDWSLDITHTFHNPGGSPFNGLTAESYIQEQLQTIEAGLALNAAHSIPLTSHLKINFDILAAISVQRTHLTGKDCLAQTFGSVCDAGHFLAATTAQPYYSRAHDREWSLGADGRLTGELVYAIYEHMEFSVGGYGGIILNQPYIRNPTFTNSAAASIEHRTAYEYGGSAKLNFRF